jgi:hypothetical protein
MVEGGRQAKVSDTFNCCNMAMKASCIIILMLMTHSFLLCQGCAKRTPYKKQPVSDVAKGNEVRRNLGIREIKEDWEFYLHQFGEETWKCGGCECKKVAYNEELNKILWEQDYYYTGVTWTDMDGTNREVVQITYDYTDGLFSVVYNGQQSKLKAVQNMLTPTYSGFKAETNEETLRVADEMLTALGKSRLD